MLSHQFPQTLPDKSIVKVPHLRHGLQLYILILLLKSLFIFSDGVQSSLLNPFLGLDVLLEWSIVPTLPNLLIPDRYLPAKLIVNHLHLQNVMQGHWHMWSFLHVGLQIVQTVLSSTLDSLSMEQVSLFWLRSEERRVG